MERTLTRMRSPCSLELICASHRETNHCRNAAQFTADGWDSSVILEWKDCLICWFVDENACDGRQREITFQILDRLVSSHCICESHTDQFTESAMKFIQCFM
ncbi:Hypothetical_protein [Hexamita inflata]|uniref:Hypothetical_protein n=1 Tax=Hexamita inflata TaxID=28002 RepID=A0AA86UV08_9EUKA|nr:Hypothetical protein HINF_LOCUS53341 [Hexamita inflata]